MKRSATFQHLMEEISSMSLISLSLFVSETLELLIPFIGNAIKISILRFFSLRNRNESKVDTGLVKQWKRDTDKNFNFSTTLLRCLFCITFVVASTNLIGIGFAGNVKSIMFPVLDKIEEVGKLLGLSFPGCEKEVRALFRKLERQIPSFSSGVRKSPKREGSSSSKYVNELRKLYSGINYRGHSRVIDDLPDVSGINKWTCTCASAQQGNQSYAVAANCSTSCDCSLEEDAVVSGGARWTCLCAGDGFPKVAGNVHDTGCFRACNCTSGSPGEPQASRKRISNKVVVIILLLCVVLTTLAFLASLGCYIYRRDKCPVQPPVFSSDKDTSCNSTTNLISHKSTSVPEFKVIIDSPVNPITGCIQKASFIFRSKGGTINGTIIQFSYSELEFATNKFSNSNLIGLGGSSHVYCGQLKDGRTVAVKRLKTQGGPDADSVFITEIQLIARLHHCHVVPLLGYCSESQGKHAERLLVFDYMPNGNLRDCLDGAPGKESMDWGTRVGIALGAARGLEYLHEAAAPRILHRDVKSTNILLDEKWRAKITDLGMAKRLRTDDLPSCSSSPARMQGTFGYFAPEYAIVGRASLKSDVFSFGVVLLELISGRQPIHKAINKGEESLVIWATPRLQDSRRVISELPDPLLEGNFPEEEMQIMAYLAKECLLLDPDSRPTMSEVVQILSTIATEKSRRRNFPVNLFQSSSTLSSKSVAEMERPDERDEGPIGAEELRRATSGRWSARCSLPLTVDRTLGVENSGNMADSVMSAGYVERLILLTSKARSWRAPDDETVDLTEPRFESFCMANVRSL
ncbi:hypothetical protein HHK36_019185 [Tetracentron sinense]|uniref:non-specific serine/threonine protein kinase n=1 Tax=Tetracentron sinense TaxID=13715 RepID=A0A834YZJ8_TETSI|nr:hypothetical protein HHK36_019185 [Tetracentron sinense]